MARCSVNVFRRKVPDPTPKSGANVRLVNIYGRGAGFDTIGAESHACIRAMDFVGMGDFAEGGLNFWFLAPKHGTPSPMFTDGDGYLLLHPYDARHSTGQGQLLRCAGTHYRLTGDTQWLRSVAPVLKKACGWGLRQQKVGPPAVAADKASVFVLPFRSEETNAIPADLCGRFTDAFIDSLALIHFANRDRKYPAGFE